MIPSWETSCVSRVPSALPRTRSCLQVISLFTFPLVLVLMSSPTINLMLVSSPTPLWPVPIHVPITYRQRTQYRSPIMGSEHALTAARNSALAGHVPPGLIPFLASPNADIIQHRLNWTLRFLSQALRPTTLTPTDSLTSRSTHPDTAVMNPCATQFNYIKHFPKPMPWSQTLPFFASPTLPMMAPANLLTHPSR